MFYIGLTFRWSEHTDSPTSVFLTLLTSWYIFPPSLHLSVNHSYLKKIARLAVSHLACKEISSHHSHSHKKKNKLNRTVFSDPLENWSDRSSHCAQSWRDKRANTENHHLSEGQECRQRNPWGARHVGDGVLQAHCGHRQLKPQGTQYSGSPHTFRHSTWELTEEWGSHREDQRKICLMLWQRERQNFFTRLETCPKHSILNKTCPQEKWSEPNLFGFYQSLTDLDK